jgi:tetratricopeptide (TPR) repeat protein
MVAASRKVVMGTRDAHVIRVPLDHKEDTEDIGDLSKKEADRVQSVFMDPLGAHVIVSLASGDNYYLNESWKKPKQMPRLKDVVVSSVAWDPQNGDRNMSSSILVGTSRGLLFECVLDMAEKGSTRVWKPVFNTESNQAIEGLTVERISPNKLYVMAVTATRIYEFCGGSNLTTVFEQYDNGVVPFHELPGSPTGHAELHLLRKARDAPPYYFAWMAESGVFHGSLKLLPEMAPGDSAMVKATLLKFPDANKNPTSMALTEHHFMFVYADKFQSVRRLDEAVVFEQVLPQRIGKVQGLCVDETATPRQYWAYSESALFAVTIVNEERDISSLYLKMGQFDLAKTYAKTQAQVAMITSAQADHLFDLGKFDQAASLYGKTDRQFEEITLKFIDKEAPNALRAFLVNKLQTLTMRDSTQKTMICTWLVEIYLNRLNALQEADDDFSKDELQSVAAEFRQMLDENKAFLDYKTTIGLITSHGRVEEMIIYANLMEDYERVINAHINKGDYKNALVVLLKQTSEELFYRFSPVLMHHAPYHTVNSWMRAAGFLKPRKLIPALMRYDPSNNPEEETGSQAIRYLEFCTKKIRNDDEAIHNYLLSLYCQSGDESKVCEFVSEPETHFDLKYALRLCSQHKMARGQVLIYGLMNLFEEAVELALNFDLELAKLYAGKPEDDDPLKKRLWLRIAKHVVTGEGNIKRAMAFLKECSVLKIEDILPFFPEFTLIDSFK